jgi:pyoverdine/dityrosine biosynthesis protein Dit1
VDPVPDPLLLELKKKTILYRWDVFIQNSFPQHRKVSTYPHIEVTYNYRKQNTDTQANRPPLHVQAIPEHRLQFVSQSANYFILAHYNV